MIAAILSDVHLGHRQFRKTVDDINVVEQAGYDQWLDSIDIIIEKKPDILFITGDLFDTPNPTMLAMSNAMKGYNKLLATDIAVITVAGNHEFSNKNHKEKSHPYSILEETYINYTFVYDDYHILELSNMDIVSLPHQQLEFKDDLGVNKEALTPIYGKIISKINKKDKKRILLTHGVLESWAEKYTGYVNDGMRVSNMVLKDIFVSNFDYTFIGHSHNHFVEKVKSSNGKITERISPGSTLDVRSEYDHGPIFIDLDAPEPKLNISKIPNIRTYKIEAKNIDEMQRALQSIKEGHIYLITYLGQWKDIPSELYEEAISKALYLNISDTDILNSSTQRQTIKGFWEWISSNDKEMEKEFREVLEKRDSKGV